MADLKYKPVPHDHEAFLKKALKRKEFRKAYEDLKKSTRLPAKCLPRVPDSASLRKRLRVDGNDKKCGFHAWNLRASMFHP